MGKASKRKKPEKPEEVKRVIPAEPLPQHVPFELVDWIAVTLILVSVLFVYGRTLCPTIFTSGAGENVTAVALLGVPHPPGFPLFCLLGKLFTILVPIGNIAYRVNLFSAVCGATASAMLYVLMKTLMGNQARFSAVAAALLFAFSLTFWSQAVISEVYTFNALVLISIFYALVRWERGSQLWPAALLAGLGLTVHPLQLFFLPGWLYFVYRSPRNHAIQYEDITRSAGAFAAGLSLHLYPLIRSKANPVLDWGNPENMKNLIAYLTASQYRERMFSLNFTKVLENAGQGALLLFRQFTPWLSVLPFAGLILLFQKHRRLFVVTIIPAILTFIYAINYNIPWEIDVYYIPIALLFAFWTGYLLTLIPQQWKKFSVVFPALAAVPLLLNFHENDRSHNRIALDYGIDLLKTAPANTSLVLPQTDAAFSILYLTTVENQRKDLDVWVHTEKGGVTTLRDGVKPDVMATQLSQILNGTKRVFLTQRVTDETVPGYKQVPFGILNLLAKNEDVTNPPKWDFGTYLLEKYANQTPTFFLDDRDRAILGSYYLNRGDYLINDKNKAAAMQEYMRAEKIGEDLAEIRSQLALRLAEMGNKTAAIAQLRESIRLMESAGDLNRLGRLLIQTKRIDEAKAAFERALKLDPNLAIAHSNLGAILGMKGDMFGAVEELETAVRLDPQSSMAHNNLAIAYLKIGKKNEAVAHWQYSLNIDPNQEDIRNELKKLNVQ
jgi:Flp pilus assembly protein TadD